MDKRAHDLAITERAITGSRGSLAFGEHLHHAAQCPEMCLVVGLRHCVMRHEQRKPRIIAPRTVGSQQILVAVPATITVSMPPWRSRSSRSARKDLSQIDLTS